MVQNAGGAIVAYLSQLNHPWVQGKNLVAAKLQAYEMFFQMVRPRGPWDPKPVIERKTHDYYHKIRNRYYYYDIWGNIMFGYLGRAAGFSIPELLNGAGAVQFYSDIEYAIQHEECSYLPRRRAWRYGAFFPAPWIFDHPHDRVAAAIGMELWRAFEINVQVRHIVEAVEAAADQGWIPTWHEKPL